MLRESGWWLGSALVGSKIRSHWPIAKVESFLLPVEKFLFHLDFLPLASDYDGGLAHLLCPVDPPHLVHLPFQGFPEGSRLVEVKVLMGFLMAFSIMVHDNVAPHPAGALLPSTLLPSSSYPPPLYPSWLLLLSSHFSSVGGGSHHGAV